MEDAARRFRQRKLELFGFCRNWIVLRIFNPFYHCFIDSASKRRSAFWVGYFRPSSCCITPVRSQALVGLLCERAGSIPSMQKTRRQCIDCSSLECNPRLLNGPQAASRNLPRKNSAAVLVYTDKFWRSSLSD